MDKTQALPVVVYTPESQLQTPGRLVREMWQDVKASRELSWRLFVRDTSAQYRQSLLGIFWAFLPPILTGLVFIVLQRENVVNLGETEIPYPVFVLVGTLLWQLFTDSLSAPLKSIITAKPMLAKINFPREALVISAFYTVIFNMLIKLVVMAGIFLFFGVELTWGAPLSLLAMLMLVLLGMCFGLLLTPLGALYSDISTSLPVITQLLFFVTPVVYPPPESFPYSLIATANPVSPLLIGARDLATKGTLTNPIPFFVVSGLTLVALVVGWVIYRVALPIIIERMSA